MVLSAPYSEERSSDAGKASSEFSTWCASFEYWPDGAIKRKQLADGTWTGQYLYDLAGRLTTIDNANTTSGLR
jgi:hypothetical protein